MCKGDRLWQREQTERAQWRLSITDATVRSAMKLAVAQGLLARSPLYGVTVPKSQRAEMRALDAEEAQRLFEATKHHREAALWMLLTTSGLRVGEALGLTWSCLDRKA